MSHRIFSHPLSPLTRRTALAITAIVIAMTVGTVGMKALTSWRWIDSFYFMAMVATAQGPPSTPPTFWSKVFAALMAFVSIGTLITAIGTIFGPFLGYVFHKGIHFAQKELERKQDRETRVDK